MEQLGEALSTGGAPAPWLYIKGRLCERFHCRPSELVEEDFAEIVQMAQLLAEGDRILNRDSAK